jgi:prephenate dehydrogenase
MVNNAEISVIGGTRGMGEWFTRFLRKEGHAVRVYGRNMNVADIRELAQACDVVVISVPIRATREVIEEVGPHMR